MAHRHITLFTAPLASLATASVGTAIPDGSGGYVMTGLTLPAGGFAVGGTLGDAYVADETALFGPA